MSLRVRNDRTATRALAGAAAVVLSLVAGACRSASPVTPTTPTTPPASPVVSIMGASRLTSVQLAAWFNGRQPQPSGVYTATVPVESLAAYFIEEGAAEGVTGDVAFVQSIVETGWFRFGGSITGAMNNFAGIGATDADPRPASFPDARTGVRAQIQHLRAYADPAAYACTVPPLHYACVDPRFNLVTPKGRAPAWNQLGNGNWATASSYATSILSRFDEALAFHGIR
jgi:hypothetical protein